MDAAPPGVHKGSVEAVANESPTSNWLQIFDWGCWLGGLVGSVRREAACGGFFDAFSGLSRNRSHHVMCTCAKYVLFYCFFVF